MKNYSFYSFLFILLLTFSCKEPPIMLKKGMWRATLSIQGKLLPFNFSISYPSSKEEEIHIVLHNGEEEIEIQKVKVSADSIHFFFHPFETIISAKIESSETMGGYWKKKDAEDYIVPFEAQYIGGEDRENKRFIQKKIKTNQDLTGKWETLFTEIDNGRKIPAVGIFSQKQNYLEGTFLLRTGDYRYLEGVVNGDSLYLSCFDGQHAYLFIAKYEEETLRGTFFSGKTGIRTWEAKKNPFVETPKSHMKVENKTLSFSLPDIEGGVVDIAAPQFENKVVIIQILGSWCPNCVDEGVFLADFYKKYQELGVEVLGLAFEIKPGFENNEKKLKKMKETLSITYPILFAGQIKDTKKVLPEIEAITAFPTMLILDKKGIVNQVHEGFYGPATGKYYETFEKNFTSLIDSLLKKEI